jgi:hypothetical protein
MGFWSKETLNSIKEAEARLSTPARWLITILLAGAILGSFVWGICTASVPYADRYPVEYSWWIDHEQLHYPGVFISSAALNTSCRQSGNIRPPHGEGITQIQWLGGWDSGFVGNIKIKYDDKEIITPTPVIGHCIYLYNVTGDVVVYGQDSASGGWIQLGKRSSNSSITS